MYTAAAPFRFRASPIPRHRPACKVGPSRRGARPALQRGPVSGRSDFGGRAQTLTLAASGLGRSTRRIQTNVSRCGPITSGLPFRKSIAPARKSSNDPGRVSILFASPHFRLPNNFGIDRLLHVSTAADQGRWDCGNVADVESSAMKQSQYAVAVPKADWNADIPARFTLRPLPGHWISAMQRSPASQQLVLRALATAKHLFA